MPRPLGDNVKGFVLDKIRRQRRAEILKRLRPGREASTFDNPVSLRPEIRGVVPIAGDDILTPLFFECSVRTMYRVLTENQSTRERRNQLNHANYKKPELLATAPNEVWSWDITKLKGPEKWTYYYLYVILDIYSRCVVGWMLADRESADYSASNN